MAATHSLDFKALFESAPDLYLVLDQELTIIGASNSYLAATKTSRDAILNKGLFEVFTDNTDDPNASGVKNLRDSLQRVLDIKQPDTMAVQKYDIKRPESEGGGFEERYWSPVNTPILNDQGQIQYILHRVEDVTEFIRLKQQKGEQSRLAQELQIRADAMEAETYLRAQQIQSVNASLRKLNDELIEAHKKNLESERVKEEFFTNISHELRTPLALILAPLESLLNDRHTTRSSQELVILRTMHNNTVRLLQMVNAILDYSKLAAGKLIVNREPLELSSLTKSFLDDFDPMLQQRQLTIKVNLPHEPILVEIDRYLFERILFNLVSNAIKFSTESGTITVTLSAVADQVTLRVQDTGIGISEQIRSTLFERFGQIGTTSAKRYEGTGLGLSLVKQFAALLGGTVTMESKEGIGSTFTVTLLAPVAQNRQANNQTSKRRLHTSVPRYEIETRTMAPINPSSMLPKVVIAEDNIELANYIATLLNDICATQIAYDGESAAQLIKEWQPDVILSDVMMPKVTGLQLCKTIKSQQRTAHIPFVLLTAQTHREALLKGWEAGADEYLFKPFHPIELLARVRALLHTVEERQLRDDERKRREEIEKFAYLAAHDLKEPVRIIATFTQLLQKRLKDKVGEDINNYCRYINDGATRIIHLIEDLAAYSAVGLQASSFEQLDCNNVVRLACEHLQASIEESQAQIEIAPLPSLEGNESMLCQLFQNLIRNSIQYCGSSAPRISISAHKLDHEWIFSVRDQGIGFRQEYAERIFLVCKRLHDRQSYPGTGIGLAICKSIIERHGGRIWAESQPDNGATFFFALTEKQEGAEDKDAIQRKSSESQFQTSLVEN